MWKKHCAKLIHTCEFTNTFEQLKLLFSITPLVLLQFAGCSFDGIMDVVDPNPKVCLAVVETTVQEHWHSGSYHDYFIPVDLDVRRIYHFSIISLYDIHIFHREWLTGVPAANCVLVHESKEENPRWLVKIRCCSLEIISAFTLDLKLYRKIHNINYLSF